MYNIKKSKEKQHNARLRRKQAELLDQLTREVQQLRKEKESGEEKEATLSEQLQNLQAEKEGRRRRENALCAEVQKLQEEMSKEKEGREREEARASRLRSELQKVNEVKDVQFPDLSLVTNMIELLDIERKVEDFSRKFKERRDQLVEERLTCQICQERDKDFVMVPCGHKMCGVCSDRMREC
eukprot:CAMPEP_0113903362 /NCGR_PEP_ID=MMETSP0780_2-20120614/22476_1 /TAXON_ID=652834 /ORGANISM="Palpitomonas bilix" /LENGTH=182 /DNA_ID=CAMNT_0000896495 /DNA_START=66 /DNA_END=611 /DNA_ORIENTATION=+ /assembly_acc=CAM_ASM_000599